MRLKTVEVKYDCEKFDMAVNNHLADGWQIEGLHVEGSYFIAFLIKADK